MEITNEQKHLIKMELAETIVEEMREAMDGCDCGCSRTGTQMDSDDIIEQLVGIVSRVVASGDSARTAADLINYFRNVDADKVMDMADEASDYEEDDDDDEATHRRSHPAGAACGAGLQR